jgi:tetratricopeptide (TPR) repeat protein/DNA-binding XRE family transcriptional regulator
MIAASTEFSSFGTLLKAFRHRQHLTQAHLAQLIGVHRHAIGRWEQGDVLPATKGLVLELAKHLRLDDQETRHFLEASLTALAPPWLVPLPRNPFFTGREALLEAVHARLGVEHTGEHLPSIVLQGLGGIGKTQIALEYAYRHALEYSAVCWIAAETEEQIVSSLLHLAEVLQLPERQESDQQRVVVAVQRWFSSHSGWLLVWDNLEDLELLSRLLPTTVQQGAILLTTRCQALGTLARGMDVVPMAQEEGMLFVLRRAKVLEPEATDEQVQQFAVRLPDEYAAARELVTTMGGLPLALDQAGAYIEETGCGFAGYLHRYQQQRRHLLARRGGIPGDHPHSVVATLGLACQQVAQQHPAALDLLRFCACLYPDAIPEELLLAGAYHLGPVLGPVVADLSLFDEDLATLRRFSLVQRQPEPHTLSLHRLVQVILQEEMSEQEHATLQQRAVHLLNTVFPESASATVVETWRQCEQLLPHVITCLATIPDHRQDQDLAKVVLRAANYLHERGQDEQAEPLYQRALHLFEQQLGPKHPQVGISLSRLAWLYLVQGKFEQAEQLFRRALHLLEQALGPEHSEVAFPLNGLAMVYHRLGHHEQAESLYQHALRIFEQALDPEHPEVAGLLDNLGNLYQELGHYEQAEAFCQRALRIFEQALGPEHPKVAYPLNNLGVLYRELGHYEQAEPLYQRALRIFEQALGPEHRQVARHAGHSLR